MGMLSDLFGLDEAMKKRYEDLEFRCRQLHEECESLRSNVRTFSGPVHEVLGKAYQDRQKALDRIRDLETALTVLLKMTEKNWAGADEQARMRAAKAVLDNKLVL